MKIIIFCILPAILLHSAWTTEILESLEEFLDTQVHSDFLPKSKTVGFGLTVTNSNGSILYSKGFGYRDIERNASATNKSLFPIGSITKSLNAIMIVKILSEMFPQYGEAVVDMPVQKLSPLVNLTLSDRYRTESISFKDLISHRNCLTDHLMGVTFGAVKTPEEYFYRSRYETEVCPFRGGAAYSNTMTVVAGHVMSQITGQPYETLMRKFLDDLGMTDSRLMSLDEDYDNLDNMIQGYYTKEGGVLVKANSKILRQVTCENPSGGLLSTPDDMAKFIYFQLNNGLSISGQQVVPKEIMQNWLLRVATPLAVDHSLGMVYEQQYLPGQGLLLKHGGYWAPFSSYLLIFPYLDIGIFTSTNGPGSATPQNAQEALHAQIFDFIAQQKGSPHNFKGTSLRPFSSEKADLFGGAKQKIEIPRNKLDAICIPSDLVGVYGNALDGEMEILMGENGDLRVIYGLFGEANLHQNETEDCKFNIEWTSDIVVILYSGMDGGVVVNTMDFIKMNDQDFLILEIGQGAQLLFKKNLNLDTLPQLPYDPTSCVAENFYGR